MRAKKHLGQNFLTSKKFIDDVVRAANLTPESLVVEIGPGKGALTAPLLKAANRVIAIEKDPELTMLLRERFAKEIKDKRFTLINNDVLDVDIEAVVGERYSLVANIPYYITGLLLRHFLSQKLQPESMTLIMQKEVAERIKCRDGKESLLSLSVSVYGNTQYVGKIPSRYFSPEPKVDSAIVHISDISRDFFEGIDEEKFFEFIKTGFEHKRKKLINNLEALYPKDVLVHAFLSCSVSENSRAEELPRELWKKLLLHATR